MPKEKSFANLKFNNSYFLLGDDFYAKTNPAHAPEPKLIEVNENLAKEFGLDIESLNSKKSAEFFSGNFVDKKSQPIALAYAGHQFGHFVPSLGDGRAVLLGEILDKKNNRFDIQLKGSGQTPFSRRGDGKAALGPVIREYVLSEATHALGIKTARSLACVATGDVVYRETELSGAVITRIASSHIRVGTFEYFAARNDFDNLKKLADYAINRHYKKCQSAENSYISFYEELIKAQSKLVASWMNIGFIHGVMNTDNFSISGETIDYGPCAFMDEYNPAMVFSSIDKNGRYAYANQPHAAHWNLARLAQAILPLFDENIENAVKIAEKCLDKFYPLYEASWLDIMRKKLGLFTKKPEDFELANEFLEILHKNNADFTNSFRDLACFDFDKVKIKDEKLKNWMQKWQLRFSSENKTKEERINLMDGANPYVIPRNHIIEKMIKNAYNGDFSLMKKVIEILEEPYKTKSGIEEFRSLPTESERVKKTFCGT